MTGLRLEIDGRVVGGGGNDGRVVGGGENDGGGSESVI